MPPLDSLIALAGNWKGAYCLWELPSEPAKESPSTASLVSLVGQKFVRIDYAWGYAGQPQEGSVLVGYEAKENLATTVWIDTWHMGDKFMICQGKMDGDGSIVVRGSYSVDSGPDWGWRTVLETRGGSLHMVMYNVTPEGKEELAVEAEYTRA